MCVKKNMLFRDIRDLYWIEEQDDDILDTIILGVDCILRRYKKNC